MEEKVGGGSDVGSRRDGKRMLTRLGAKEKKAQSTYLFWAFLFHFVLSISFSSPPSFFFLFFCLVFGGKKKRRCPGLREAEQRLGKVADGHRVKGIR